MKALNEYRRPKHPLELCLLKIRDSKNPAKFPDLTSEELRELLSLGIVNSTEGELITKILLRKKTSIWLY
ncbi:hypothetical protein KKG82_02825 [Patescibacteria group bacterium]|nr:hypothetical protein [Patescibacteria group bacterium]